MARDWTRLKDAPQKVRGDRAAALAAVRQSPEALRYLEPHLRLDRQIVMAAIATQPRRQAQTPEEECAVEVAAFRAMEDMASLGSMALELGYSTFRFTQVLCNELMPSSPSEVASAASSPPQGPQPTGPRTPSVMDEGTEGSVWRRRTLSCTRSCRQGHRPRFSQAAITASASHGPGHWTRSISAPRKSQRGAVERLSCRTE